jgi:hypothetical protein
MSNTLNFSKAKKVVHSNENALRFGNIPFFRVLFLPMSTILLLSMHEYEWHLLFIAFLTDKVMKVM